MIKYEIPEILKDHEDLIKRTIRFSNEISFKREETKLEKQGLFKSSV